MKYVLEYTLYNGYNKEFDGRINTLKSNDLEQLLLKLHELQVKYSIDNLMDGWRLYNAETKTLLLCGLGRNLDLYSNWRL